MPLVKADQPFVFKAQLSLVETMGLKACDLFELCKYLKESPDSSVYYHTHHFLQQHQHLTPEPPNDYAYWVTQVLQEDVAGEKLAAVDTVRYGSLAALREAIVGTIEPYLSEGHPLRKAPPGEEFYFMKCTLFNLPTRHQATDLAEFLDCLNKVSIGCLYNHVFEARLRAPVGLNDFSYWLSSALGETALAAKIEKMDPYTQTMEGLRRRLIRLTGDRLRELGHGAA